MKNTVSYALDDFFNQLDADKREKYKIGILDFVSKLSALSLALSIQDTKNITALLHSVKPISEYLKLTELHNVLSKIVIEDSRTFTDQLLVINDQINFIQDYFHLRQ